MQGRYRSKPAGYTRRQWDRVCEAMYYGADFYKGRSGSLLHLIKVNRELKEIS